MCKVAACEDHFGSPREASNLEAPTGQRNERAAAMCEDLASKFRERGLWPFSRLVALDGSYLSVALNFAPYKN